MENEIEYTGIGVLVWCLLVRFPESAKDEVAVNSRLTHPDLTVVVLRMLLNHTDIQVLSMFFYF